MPQLQFAVQPGGLLVPVYVGWDGDTILKCVAAGQPTPGFVHARGLLDTGSDCTAVAPWIVQQLGLPVAATAKCYTASAEVEVNLYSIGLSITYPNLAGGPTLVISDLRVSALTADLPDTDVLIGLDVLLECKLLLDGPARRFLLDF